MYYLEFYPDTVQIENKVTLIEGTLVVSSEDNVIAEFRANSGGYGKGCLPHGVYTLRAPVELNDDGTKGSYKKDYKPWWASLTALFNTDRSELGLHADGGIKGSLGCLVLAKNDWSFYETLNSIFKEQKELLLTVF